MSEHQHYEGCHLHHFPCCLAEVRRLTVENAQLRNGVIEPDWMTQVRRGGMVGEETQTGALTHSITLKLHAPGPTWSHHNDEPPTR